MTRINVLNDVLAPMRARLANRRDRAALGGAIGATCPKCERACGVLHPDAIGLLRCANCGAEWRADDATRADVDRACAVETHRNVRGARIARMPHELPLEVYDDRQTRKGARRGQSTRPEA